MNTRKLSDEEILERHKRILSCLEDMAAIELRKAQFNKAIREEFGDVKSELGKLRREIRSGEVEVSPQGVLI